MSSTAYHTALTTSRDNPAEGEPKAVHYGSLTTALVHDLTTGLHPKTFALGRVIYGEPPFHPGWSEFHRRAGIEPRLSYADFMRLLDAEAVRAVGQGVDTYWLVSHKVAARHLTSSGAAVPVRINGGSAVMACYGPPLSGNLPDAEDVIRFLAGKYQSVADPACGFGRAGRIFAEVGKSSFLTDISPICIGHIAAQPWAQ